MVSTLRDRYKVLKKDYETSYDYQLGLKRNEEYERIVEDAFIKIVDFFGKFSIWSFFILSKTWIIIIEIVNLVLI